jgi:CobQ-like glutamine amidotransferase family enzyme
MKNFRIGYFYPEELNLYGDDGNVQILKYRAEERGFKTEVIEITTKTELTKELMDSFDLVFMGGGPDSSQKEVYEDLITKKGDLLKEYIENMGVGLFICGSYQLLGHKYISADGTELQGLGVFDIYTQHFGNHKPRCIGNLVCTVINELRHDPIFNHMNKIGETLVGFENHGGRTYLGTGVFPLANVKVGHGNNSEDKTEGAIYKNAIGTYFHGPLLSRNPHLADYLLAKALKVDSLAYLDDSLIIKSHTASKRLKQ